MSDPSRLSPALLNAVDQIDYAVRAFEEHPDPAVRRLAVDMLAAIDTVHREGLRRLSVALDVFARDLREQVLREPDARLLFEMYELVEPKILPVPESPRKTASFVPLDQIKFVARTARAER